MSRRVKDIRVLQGRRNRNASIRSYFSRRLEAGYRYDFIVDEIIKRWGLSESTINQIIKGYGGYKNND